MKDLEQLLDENKNFIYKLASKYSVNYNIDDLFQVGVIGFIKAYNNYKDGFNTKFTTYAYKYVLGEIFEYIRNDRNIKVGSDTLKLYNAYLKSYEFLVQKYNRNVSLNEISAFMGIDSDYLCRIIERCSYTRSLDSMLNDDFSLDKVVGLTYENIIDNNIDLNQLINDLSQEEKELIMMRYYNNYTQSEVANYLGMNQVQVSRNEQRILKKMRYKICA